MTFWMQYPTNRINTNELGAVISRHDYRPYGEEITERTHSQYAADTIRKQFTGYERDGETELDYAKARMFGSRGGRFTNPDPLLSSGRLTAPQTWNRYSYTINNPIRFIDPDGLCTAPTGLKVGQVGICFEAFIASPTVGGIGKGDGRGHSGNDPNLTARVTVWAIVSTDANSYRAVKSGERIEPSVVNVAGTTEGGFRTAKTGEVSSGTLSFQGTADTSVTATNNGMLKGETDFGPKGVDVTVSIANGANGGQVFAKDMQTAGAVVAGTSVTTAGQVSGKIINGAGQVGEALAPKGTIDGSATLRITGNGQVTYVGGETRPFPSYAIYAYTVGADGKTTQIVYQRTRDETPPVENLTKPKMPW